MKSGETMKITRELAMMFAPVRFLIDMYGECEHEAICTDISDLKTASKIIQWCIHNVHIEKSTDNVYTPNDFDETLLKDADDTMLYEMMMSANFLELEHLMCAISSKICKRLNGAKASEISSAMVKGKKEFFAEMIEPVHKDGVLVKEEINK